MCGGEDRGIERVPTVRVVLGQRRSQRGGGRGVLLGQVTLNLIDNALKYSPADSGIEIRASVAAANLTVSIADHGIGIPATDLTKIFDKFYRVQHDEISVPGTGLGLAICKSIVEAHGGRIWAENRSEGGAVFSFSVPLTKVANPPDVSNAESR